MNRLIISERHWLGMPLGFGLKFAVHAITALRMAVVSVFLAQEKHEQIFIHRKLS